MLAAVALAMALVGLFGAGPVGPKPAQAGIVINPCLVVECATLTIVMHGDGTGDVNSMEALNQSATDGIIECRRQGGTTFGTCSHDYVIASGPIHVYLRIHAFPGSGVCNSAGQNCTPEKTIDLILDNDGQQHANIVLADPRTLTVTTSGAGKGAVTSVPVGIDCGAGGSACSVHFAHGSTVKLTAAANAGSTFKRWEGACSGSSKTCSVSMGDDRSVEAVFAKLATPAPATPKPSATPKPPATAKPPAATQPAATPPPTIAPSEPGATPTTAPAAAPSPSSIAAATDAATASLPSPAPSPLPSASPSATVADSGVGLLALAIVLAGLLIGIGVGVYGYLRRKRV